MALGKQQWRPALGLAAVAFLTLTGMALLRLGNSQLPPLAVPSRSTQSPKPPLKVAAPPTIIAMRGEVSERNDAMMWPQAPHAIHLRYRDIMPDTDVPEGVVLEQRAHWLVQFGGPLNADERAALKAQGLEFLLPTVDMAWHVRASFKDLLAAQGAGVPKLLGWGRVLPDDKLLPAVRARLSDAAIAARLELYPGANAMRVARELETAGAVITALGKDYVELSSKDIAAAEFCKQAAALDDVYAVDVPRPRLKAFNLQASNASNITAQRGAPRNLTGAGINVLVRDEGRIFSHPDLAGRVVLSPDTIVLGSTDQHSTHVAGTIGGTGSINAAALGMAPGCAMISQDLNGDDFNEPLSGKYAYNALLSNHSYGFVTGWDSGVFSNNQDTFGQYSSFARSWDVLARNEGLIMVKAVGNDRNDTGPGFPHDGTQASDGEFYDCVDASSTSKNIICVGSADDSVQAGVSSSSTVVLPSSSAGPCDDGRIRPEIIANGDTLLSCNNSVVPGSEYTALSGTSMAAAVVTGATALFLQRYQQRFGAGTFAAPHYIRAIYAQTATDMGRPGPDHLHGFGMLDLDAALTLFETDNGSGTRLPSSTIDAGTPERYYVLTSDGITPIQATLCWTDEPGDQLAARALVNDLDLRLINAANLSETLPYVLNRANPSQAAINAVNTVDNIEQVRLLAPAAGQYLLAVRGTTLATPTAFTLASSHALVEDLAPVAKITSSATTGSPPLNVTFDSVGSFDPDGTITDYEWDFGDGTSASGATTQHTFNAGSFTVKLRVIDAQRASSTASVMLGVANQQPNAVASATPDAGLPPLSLLFSSAGSFDPDGTLVDFLWDFGDGTTANGPTVSHTYPAPGFYFATLTVTDNGGAVAKTNVSVLAGTTFTPKTSRFNLNFKRIAADKFTLSTTKLPCDPTLNPAGLSGTLRIGSREYSFKLDDKGKFNTVPVNIMFKPSKTTLRVTVSRTSLDDTLGLFGATNNDAKNLIVRVPFAVVFDGGVVFGHTGLAFSYKAKRGVSGAAAFKP